MMLDKEMLAIMSAAGTRPGDRLVSMSCDGVGGFAVRFPAYALCILRMRLLQHTTAQLHAAAGRSTAWHSSPLMPFDRAAHLVLAAWRKIQRVA